MKDGHVWKNIFVSPENPDYASLEKRAIMPSPVL